MPRARHRLVAAAEILGMNRKVGAFAAALAVLAATFSSGAWADWELNMPRGVTTISTEVYGLHMLILWVCVVIGVGVFAAMIYAIVTFRKDKGVQPAKFAHKIGRAHV